MQIEVVRITDGFGKVRVIGRRVDDTFYTTRRYSDHHFKKYDAWAVDIDVINRADIQNFVLLDVEKDIEYYATKKLFETVGKKMQWPGHGEQVALPLIHWGKYEVVR